MSELEVLLAMLKAHQAIVPVVNTVDMVKHLAAISSAYDNTRALAAYTPTCAVIAR